AVDVPRPTVVGVVRRELAGLRSEKQVPDFEAVLARIRCSLDALRRSRILPVINGTGVIVHTNLGRSPLGPAVVETLQAIAANYNNLEFDLTGGERGCCNWPDRKSTRLNSSHEWISYAVFCLKTKNRPRKQQISS